jgi:hypothetical protein
MAEAAGKPGMKKAVRQEVKAARQEVKATRQAAKTTRQEAKAPVRAAKEKVKAARQEAKAPIRAVKEKVKAAKPTPQAPARPQKPTTKPNPGVNSNTNNSPTLGRYDSSNNYIGASSPLSLPEGRGMTAMMAQAIRNNPSAYPGYSNPNTGKNTYTYQDKKDGSGPIWASPNIF